jgi:hypothetical protein
MNLGAPLSFFEGGAFSSRSFSIFLDVTSAPGEIRTPDLVVVSQNIKNLSCRIDHADKREVFYFIWIPQRG